MTCPVNHIVKSIRLFLYHCARVRILAEVKGYSVVTFLALEVEVTASECKIVYIAHEWSVMNLKLPGTK